MSGTENIMLSEKSQVQKDKGHMFSLICGKQIQIQAFSYLHIYVQNMFFRSGTMRRDKGGGKEVKNDRE
jgi:hypothetical protein